MIRSHFFSMILSKNAFTGYTFEHSWGDGVAGNVLLKVIDLIFTNFIVNLYLGNMQKILILHPYC